MVEKDGVLKKLQTAYCLWLGENRERITTMVGSGEGSDFAKKGVEWKALSDDARQPYEKKAKEQKDAYDKFIATEEGKKALGHKKTAQAEAKAEKAKKEKEKVKKVAAKEKRINKRFDQSKQRWRIDYYIRKGEKPKTLGVTVSALPGDGAAAERVAEQVRITIENADDLTDRIPFEAVLRDLVARELAASGSPPDLSC